MILVGTETLPCSLTFGGARQLNDLTAKNAMNFSVICSEKATRIKLQYFHEIGANWLDFAKNGLYNPSYLFILENKNNLGRIPLRNNWN